jgi:hypothetical protein
LLLLHSVAKKIIGPSVRSSEPVSRVTASALTASAALPHVSTFGPTNILPLSAQLQETPPPLPVVLPLSHPVAPGDATPIA